MQSAFLKYSIDLLTKIAQITVQNADSCGTDCGNGQQGCKKKYLIQISQHLDHSKFSWLTKTCSDKIM